MSTSWSNLYLGWSAGMTDYISQHISNYSKIQNCLDYLYSLVGGARAILDVPLGLQEIFDRDGIIGQASYQPPSGVIGTSLTVPLGAAWMNKTFLYKSTSTVISLAGMTAGTYYIVLDGIGNPSVSDSIGTTTIWQFDWNGSNTVSGVELYSGVSILFDGDDYADSLTSAYWNKTFTSIADRLEDIEHYLGKAVQIPTPADTININWSLGSHIRVTLNRATTTFNFSGAYDGQKCTMELIQDEVGGREVAFGGNVKDGTDFTFPIPLSAADKRDFVGFVYSTNSGFFNYVSLARGY
jgi:hypothetical protein